MSLGANYGTLIGDPSASHALCIANGATAADLSALNVGWCTRFTARTTDDILSVVVNWSTVTAAGTVELRIETIDATSGKPTGTLYDANAVLSFTPTAGYQVLTFAVAPTTGLTVGTEYGVMLLTTTGGTAHSLRSHTPNASWSVLPCALLTAANGTTRTNFASVTTSLPCLTLIMETGIEERFSFCPYHTVSTYDVYGTLAAGVKFVVPPGVSYYVDGVVASIHTVGTPAGNLRVRILDSTDTAVSGATFTTDKDSFLLATRTVREMCEFPFASPVRLIPGTYRAVFDSSSSANSSNCWRIPSGVANASSCVPSSHIVTSTADITAGPITWTDTNTECPGVSLKLDSFLGGAARLINGGIV